MRRTKPQSVSSDYVVGLTDGEGCFYVGIHHSPRYKTGASIRLHFYIKMQKQDKELLEKVKETLHCGAVYLQMENRPNHVQCYRYTVHSNRDILEKIIPFFQQYPLQSVSKARNFSVFKKIAVLVSKQEHLQPTGIEKIKKLKSVMNNGSRGLA